MSGRTLSMTRYRIEITDPATKDLNEIGNYITDDLLEPQAALRLVNEIADAVSSLEEMPYRNPLVRDERLSLHGIRKIIVGNYLVFYIIYEEEKVVTIIRILYGRRDWLNLL
jgi:addiction module RelE/StbE family toxin